MLTATSRRAIMMAVLAAFSFTSAPGSAKEPYGDITVSFSDFGINQNYDEGAAPVQSGFGSQGQFGILMFTKYRSDVFSDTGPDVARILIQMPSDVELSSLSDQELRQRYAKDINQQMHSFLDQGMTKFDLQFVENINSLGYSSGKPGQSPLEPNRQDLIDRFGSIGYGALADVITALKPQSNSIGLFGTLGSNGTSMWARARQEWQPIASLMDSVTLTDGRAKQSDVEATFGSLDPARLRIIVNHADAWAPDDSIARLSVGEQVQHKFPDVTLLLLTKMSTLFPALPSINPIDQHIASMANDKALFHVEQKFDDGNSTRSVSLGDFSRAEIHPFVTVSVYQQLQGKLPPVWHDTGDLPGGRGGVEFRFVPVSAGPLQTDLVRKVLGGQNNKAGVWTIQRQEGR